MNNPLLSPSLAQQEYLADQLRRRSMIRIWRILLLILILSLWELSASLVSSTGLFSAVQA